jgi:hypothetical protein
MKSVNWESGTYVWLQLVCDHTSDAFVTFWAE